MKMTKEALVLECVCFLEGGQGRGSYKPRPLSDVTVSCKALAVDTMNNAVFRDVTVHSFCMWHVLEVQQDSRRQMWGKYSLFMLEALVDQKTQENFLQYFPVKNLFYGPQNIVCCSVLEKAAYCIFCGTSREIAIL